MSVDIICADVREALARFPDGHFHCCVTSPPFWGLRDYGLEPTAWGPDDCEHEWVVESLPAVKGERGAGTRWQHEDGSRGNSGYDYPGATEKWSEIKSHKVDRAFCRRCNAWRGTLGLEPTPELYVEHLVSVMREVRRVLRDDGTLWLNLGDSYCSSPRGNDPGDYSTSSLTNPQRQDSLPRPSYRRDRRPREDDPHRAVLGLKPKDLVGIPWMVAFALRADGWWLRSDIVWSKPNPMPESVRDRPTRSHEYLFLLTKSQRYYYDQDAIREPITGESVERYAAGYKGSWKRAREGSVSDERMKGHEAIPEAAGRNRRSVWEIATQPYPDAHFATFPEKLVEPCILTTSEWGCCPDCGAPWERVVERKAMQIDRSGNHPPELRTRTSGTMTEPPQSETTGWDPTCDCLTMDEMRTMVVPSPVPCRVLDPFAGSGTVGLVAERLGRHSVLIDAKEEYCEMARHRTAQRGLMVEAAS